VNNILMRVGRLGGCEENCYSDPDAVLTEQLEQALVDAYSLQWPRLDREDADRWDQAWQELGTSIVRLNDGLLSQVEDLDRVVTLLTQARQWYAREIQDLSLQNRTWDVEITVWSLVVAAANFIECIDLMFSCLKVPLQGVLSPAEMVHSSLQCPYLRLEGDNLGWASAIVKEGMLATNGSANAIWLAADNQRRGRLRDCTSLQTLQIVEDIPEWCSTVAAIPGEAVAVHLPGSTAAKGAVLWEGMTLVSLDALERLEFGMLYAISSRARALLQIIDSSIALAECLLAYSDPILACVIWQYPNGDVTWTIDPTRITCCSTEDVAWRCAFENVKLLLRSLLLTEFAPGGAIETLAPFERAEVEDLIDDSALRFDLESLRRLLVCWAQPSIWGHPGPSLNDASCAAKNTICWRQNDTIILAGRKYKCIKKFSERHNECVYKVHELVGSKFRERVLKVVHVKEPGPSPIYSAMSQAWPLYRLNPYTVAKPCLLAYSSASLKEFVFLSKYAGKTLNSWANTAKNHELVIVSMQLLQALQSLQRCGLAHNDIKPTNICVNMVTHLEQPIPHACFIDISQMRPFAAINALSHRVGTLLDGPTLTFINDIKRTLCYGTICFMPRAILGGGLSCTTTYSETESLVASLTDAISLRLECSRYRSELPKKAAQQNTRSYIDTILHAIEGTKQMSPYAPLAEMSASRELCPDALRALLNTLAALTDPNPLLRIDIAQALKQLEEAYPDELALMQSYHRHLSSGGAASHEARE